MRWDTQVILLHDLIDCARPGEEIQVTGEKCEQRWPRLDCHDCASFSLDLQAKPVLLTTLARLRINVRDMLKSVAAWAAQTLPWLCV